MTEIAGKTLAGFSTWPDVSTERPLVYTKIVDGITCPRLMAWSNKLQRYVDVTRHNHWRDLKLTFYPLPAESAPWRWRATSAVVPGVIGHGESIVGCLNAAEGVANLLAGENLLSLR